MSIHGGRFVVLFHEGHPEGDHWDLMLEDGDSLATWQLARWPIDGSGPGEAVREIFRHRSRYLDYEGPVSGDRGVVRRADAGRYERSGRDEGRWAIQFAGQTLRGRFVLERVAGERWRLQRVE